jgi:hypothetical protein
MLETLDGNPMDSLFNARCLHAFEPREGTKLAFNELLRENELDGEEIVAEQEDGIVV